MKHHDKNRKLGRPRGQRRALLKSLAISLIEKEKITTTEAKAKELRPFVERLISLAKTDTVGRRRIVSSRIFNNAKVTKKIFSEMAPRYEKRSGGYTRVLKAGKRKGDASKMAVIEFV